MQKLIHIIGVMSLLLFSTSLHAQDGYTVVTQDLETWSSIGLKIKPHKKFNIGLEQGFRFNQNSSVTDQILTELNFKFKPTKYLFFGAGFRYISDRGGNNLFDNDFRYNFDAGFKHELGDFSFLYRLRYQNKNEIGYSKTDGDVHKNYLRLKARVKYGISDWKLDPVFSGEIFRDMTAVTGGFDRLRLTLGTSYDFKKYGEIDLWYGMERELGVSYPKTTWIIGLGYTFTLKTYKKNED